MFYVEDIYFFEVNTKYISSSVLKASAFSRVHKTSEIMMFSTHEMKHIWYLPKKSIFSSFLYFLLATCNVSTTEKGGAENAKKRKKLANPNNFGTKIFVTF